jgi:hypothetical protein
MSNISKGAKALLLSGVLLIFVNCPLMTYFYFESDLSFSTLTMWQVSFRTSFVFLVFLAGLFLMLSGLSEEGALNMPVRAKVPLMFVYALNMIGLLGGVFAIMYVDSPSLRVMAFTLCCALGFLGGMWIGGVKLITKPSADIESTTQS